MRSLQRFVICRQRGDHHGNLVCIRSNRLQVMLVGQERIRSADKIRPEIRGHGLDHVFLPEKAVAAARAEISQPEIGHAAQPLDLAPQLGFRTGVQDVETELAEFFQMSAGFQLIEDGKRIQLPHGGFGPEAVKGEMKLVAIDFQFVVRQPEIALQPFQESWLENSAAAIERVAGQPDQL